MVDDRCTSLPRIGTADRGAGNRSFQTVSTTDKLNSKGLPVQLRQAETLDENRIVLYKRGKQLGNGYYIVEISSNNS